MHDFNDLCIIIFMVVSDFNINFISLIMKLILKSTLEFNFESLELDFN